MTGEVVVVGDLLLDRDIIGVADRLCPDAPVPVLTEMGTTQRPGGAGLAATFLCLDGLDVVLVGAIGTNEAGDTARAMLEHTGVGLVEIPYDGDTPEKIRLKAGRHPLLRLDRGVAVGRFGDLPVDAVDAMRGASAVLVSDYGRGVTAMPSVRRVLADVARHTPVIWDPHPQGATPVLGAILACPNRSEAAAFSAAQGVDLNGRPVLNPAAVAAEARLLRSVWRVGAVVVTMGPEGAMLAEADLVPVTIAAPVNHQGDTCGAGDRFAAAATLGLARGHTVRAAVAEAVAAASHYVETNGLAGIGSELAMEATT
jgi:D-beta-D-heptose 7-phosphate kinase/D-beta-D-heptose 1-phosphate adenosyltransferase